MSTARSPLPAGKAASAEYWAGTKVNAASALARGNNFITSFQQQMCQIDKFEFRRAIVCPRWFSEAQRGRALAEPAPSQPHILKVRAGLAFFIRRGLLRRF